MKYMVTLIYDASESIEVEADNVSDAISKAYENAAASVCCHCSEHLELGDAIKEMVCDMDGNILKDTTDD